MSEAGFSGTKAATIVGITYRQLDYWARTDLIRPSLADASGSGSRRLYSYRDLLELRVASLRDAWAPIEEGDSFPWWNAFAPGTTTIHAPPDLPSVPNGLPLITAAPPRSVVTEEERRRQAEEDW